MRHEHGEPDCAICGQLVLRLAAWRPIVEAAREATLAYDAQLVPRVPTDMRAIAARSEIAAILAMRAAVRALPPPEHRP